MEIQNEEVTTTSPADSSTPPKKPRKPRAKRKPTRWYRLYGLEPPKKPGPKPKRKKPGPKPKRGRPKKKRPVGRPPKKKRYKSASEPPKKTIWVDPTPGDPGRPAKVYPSYKEVRDMVRARGITSRQQYWDWHDTEQPIWTPKFPNRVAAFREDWISWSEFLGTANMTFGYVKPTNMKPYWDAVRVIQSMRIPSAQEYLQMYKDGKIPADIPKWPNTFYEEWTGWPDFLGKNIQAVVQSVEMQKPIWVVIHMPEDSPNIIWFLKVSSIDNLKTQIKPNWRVLGKYWYEEDLVEEVWAIIERNSAEHFEREQRLCSNVNQLVWELTSKLLIVK